MNQINPTNQINDFFDDLCFDKKFEKEKKGLYKVSISKSIYVDTYHVLFVIIVTECDISPNKIFFLTSQKGGGITSTNYSRVKNDVTYWITIVSDRNQIHAASNFLLLSSYIESLCRINLLHTTAPGYKGWRKE